MYLDDICGARAAAGQSEMKLEANVSSNNSLSQIREAKELFDCGAITQAQFDKQSSSLLSASLTDPASKIMKTKELLDCGAITEAEYRAKTAELLGQM